MSDSSLWERFQQYYLRYDELGFALDVSRMRFGTEFLAKMAPMAETALVKMANLEGGALANPDENRMVGHYWLRAPALAPTPEIRGDIERTLTDIGSFAAEVHGGELRAKGGTFTHLLVAGIGGSALGPQLVAEALGTADDRMSASFLDNTDPDGFDRAFQQLKKHLKRTLVVVISKSGGTKETRNGMLEAQASFRAAGLNFGRQAVAITGSESVLDQLAQREGWLRRFPMWDWVGGRTSVTSAVGLVPAALQGVNIKAFLDGAAAMDKRTRSPVLKQNAAMLLALMWYFVGKGRGERDMVILPYKDRLVLLSKYLQQLVMESLGKEKDLQGEVVNQGIAVYGNKGSTDQHAYVQQLRDGVLNFFVTFVEVLKGRHGGSIEVEPRTTSGDFLQGFLRGTRNALYENERDSITLTVAEVGPLHLGALIALYERAVGFYAFLVGINAYHQPGVEAGKQAASKVIGLQLRVRNVLEEAEGETLSVEEIAHETGSDPEEVYHVLNHLAANYTAVGRAPASALAQERFSWTDS